MPTMEFDQMSDDRILKEMGRRLQRERLNRNLTQQSLAQKTGLARRTLVKAENGEGTTLGTLLAMLRGLGLLARIDQLLPEPPLSPVQLAKLKGRERRRASGSRVAETPGTWTWKE